MMYNINDSFPFQSLPTALWRGDDGPWAAMITCWRIKYAKGINRCIPTANET